MKSHSLTLAGIVSATILASALQSAPRSVGKMPMRDVATHNELSASLRMAQQSDPIRLLGPPAGKSDEDPSLRNSSRDLIKESTVVCFNGSLTLVPKRAVIFIPEHLKDRIGVKPKQEVKRWRDFLPANRGWIRTFEVSPDQAMGYAPIAKATLEAMQQGSSMIVATFKSGPISVLPLKTKEELEKLAEDGVIKIKAKNTPENE